MACIVRELVDGQLQGYGDGHEYRAQAHVQTLSRSISGLIHVFLT